MGYPPQGVGGVAAPPDFPFKLELNVVRWGIPGWYIPGTSTTVITAGGLYYEPIFVEKDHTYIRIGIEVTVAAAAGSLARLGIYEWDSGLPGSLILDAGTVATDPGAPPVMQQIVIAQFLPRGYYFLAIVADNTPTLAAPNSGASNPPLGGFTTVLPTVTPPYYVVLWLDGRIGDVAGGLVDPAPAPTMGVDPDWGAFVWMREN